MFINFVIKFLIATVLKLDSKNTILIVYLNILKIPSLLIIKAKEK